MWVNPQEETSALPATWKFSCPIPCPGFPISFPLSLYLILSDFQALQFLIFLYGERGPQREKCLRLVTIMMKSCWYIPI